jgi:hypothetical protein
MHRAHQDAIAQLRKAQIERCEQVRVRRVWQAGGGRHDMDTLAYGVRTMQANGRVGKS